MSAEGSIIRLKHRVHPPAKRKRLELSKVCRKVSTQTVTLARGDSKLEKGRREEAPASCTEKETQLRILLTPGGRQSGRQRRLLAHLSEPLTNKKDDYMGSQTPWSTPNERQLEDQLGSAF